MDPIEVFRGKQSTSISFSPGERSVSCGTLNPDGDLLFCACQSEIFSYNLFTERCFQVYGGHDGAITDIAASKDLLVSVGTSQHVVIHQFTDKHPIINHSVGQLLGACALQASHDLIVLSTAQMKQAPHLFYFIINRKDKALSEKLRFKLKNQCNTVKWKNDNQVILGSIEGELLLFDLKEKNIIKTINAHRGVINSISISPDRKFFATASAEAKACIWDYETFEKLGTFVHSQVVSSVAISPIGPHVVLASSLDQKDVATTRAGGSDFTIVFYHLVYQERFAQMKVHKSTVNFVLFTPDGYTLITGAYEGVILIIRLAKDYKTILDQHKLELEGLNNQE